MNATANPLIRGLRAVALSLSAAALVSSCAQNESQTRQAIAIDGSSTVYPITNSVTQQFKSENSNAVEVTVEFSGTGGGFEKFCAGQTDINDASRPINPQEMQACKDAGVPYIELPIAFDAITVVVHPENTWAQDITVAELEQMWQPQAQGKIVKWNQIRPSWPDRPLTLYGPGSDSGTFDYFTEAIVGQPEASRDDYTASEDDEILVEDVSDDPNALGYFGYAYYESNADKLKALPVDSGNGPVMPSPETVENAEYQPLARPLFIYVNADAAQKNPALRDFVEFYIDKAPQLVSSVGYIPLPEDGYRLTYMHFHRNKVGTVFEGKSDFNLTIGQLLRKQAKF
ncbi:PstS family phosphate ABC transporter substrate-binding protein [Phormidium sp. CCY1219]|uniref:PstS family phosphate ABC transporter substrate-binding protein n=1 Tax=Phormidium sp. CCY1219 TaxID=2886104 RepID=UPI002D1F5977|nr:PstS family phosphate ABC transporter substrate-binding protein [Phormidium sp. CCY1219]MEB3826409.1 PstS family phosphate ABC transporter substrate-binding protein [Phormidium sp. CCY1219]